MLIRNGKIVGKMITMIITTVIMYYSCVSLTSSSNVLSNCVIQHKTVYRLFLSHTSCKIVDVGHH